MVVKNEDRFIWYAISSVLPYVDRFLIFDTGSTDNTVAIIKSFRERKIVFQQFHISKEEEMAELRNKQIQLTGTDWFWIVDGDEIYPNELCQEILEAIDDKGERLEGIVVGRYDLLGDIYHYQDESVGSYELLRKAGHIVLRLINQKNIAGLHVKGIYPCEGYYDEDGVEIIKHDKNKFSFTKGRLFHAMYLKRSSQGATLTNTLHRRKWKIELGNRFSSDFNYPEVFYSSRPSFLPDVTMQRSFVYEFWAYLVTPVKVLKRKIWRFLT